MSSAPSAPVARAYATCEAITRTQARNFFYGIRLLPGPKRRALSAVYALARRIDDIGDDAGPSADKIAALDAVRAALDAPPDPADPVLVAVADAADRFPIPMGAFGELVDGVERDVRMDAGTVGGYPTFPDLVWYCRCVAGAVGRLCLGVFGARPHPDATRYADALGIALQQTNILRDIREDLLNGRVYLPQEDLDRFGVTLALDDDGALADPDGGLAALIGASARAGPRLVRRRPAAGAAARPAQRRLHHGHGGHLPQAARRHRRRTPPRCTTGGTRLSGRQKLGVAARALAGRG